MAISEPSITINGNVLTEGQSMTVRVALETFNNDLERYGLGNDETGKNICEGYKQNIKSIREFIWNPRN